MVADSWKGGAGGNGGSEKTLSKLALPVGLGLPHLVLEQKLVPADEDLPQPLQNVRPVDHLLAGQPAADQEEDLRTGPKGL